jgi:hypothetical protein
MREYEPTGKFYTDSRGWVWKEEDYKSTLSPTMHWILDHIDGLPCYGSGLHLWVGFNWFGDQKWHVGSGGSPITNILYDTPEEAMENALGPAIEYVTHRMDRTGKDFERALTYAVAILPKDEDAQS